MPERAILRAHFAALGQVARDAAAEYDRLIASAGDDHTRGQLRQLARDEQRHLELTDRLMDIVDE